MTLENKRVSAGAAAYVRELSTILNGRRDVVGYAFAVNGQLQGAEVYASQGLFRKLWPKLLHANAIEALADLGKEKRIDSVPREAVVACLQDAEKGQAVERDVTKWIRLVWRETEGNILLETRDQARQDAWLHRTYVAKKTYAAKAKAPPATLQARPASQ